MPYDLSGNLVRVGLCEVVRWVIWGRAGSLGWEQGDRGGRSRGAMEGVWDVMGASACGNFILSFFREVVWSELHLSLLSLQLCG